MNATPLPPNEATTDLDDRCPVGVPGLDEVLCGGLPRNCFYLLQGDAGAGKTTLALQFLLEGVKRGEPTFYVTFSETKREVNKVARSHGWTLDAVPVLDMSAFQELLRPEAHTTIFHASDMELGRVTSLLLDQLNRTRPVRAVIDSLSELRLISETSLRYHRQLLALKEEFARNGSTVLLLDDSMPADRRDPDPRVLSLAHGVIDLEQLSPDYGTTRRRLRIRKLRGACFREGHHDFVIAQGGLTVFPRLDPSAHRVEYRPQPVSSGIPELDAMLGGGLDRGTTTLVLGPAGAGKSTLALQYVLERAAQGESALMFTFDETRSLLLCRARALGMDIDKYVTAGLVSVQQVDPAELSPGEFAVRVRQAVEGGCRVVVIDSLNGYLNAMPGERYLTSQLHELSSFLNHHNVLTILVLAQHGLVTDNTAPVDISYLADTVVSLRFFETAGEVKQAIAVIKKRSGLHERLIRELRLDQGEGLQVGRPLKEFQGVLTGVPVYRGSAEDILKAGDDRGSR